MSAEKVIETARGLCVTEAPPGPVVTFRGDGVAYKC